MTNATPTGSVCPLRRPPKGKDHPSASRTAFFGLPPDSRNPSSPQPSRLLDSPHHHADVGLADEKSGLAPVQFIQVGQASWPVLLPAPPPPDCSQYSERSCPTSSCQNGKPVCPMMRKMALA